MCSKNNYPILTCLFVTLLHLLGAEILQIPSDYPTIQAGIDNASAGDTVLVSPGTYYENLHFPSYNLILGSQFITTGDTAYIAQTILDGDRRGSVVTIQGNQGAETRLSGFTVSNGSGTGYLVDGTTFYTNQAQYCGGGLFIRNSAPVLDHLIISGNHLSLEPSASLGGGIYCEHSQLTMSQSHFVNNSAYTGGGLILNTAVTHLEDIVIAENMAYSCAGIYALGSSLECNRMSVTQNTGDIYYLSSVVLADCPNTFLEYVQITDNLELGLTVFGCDPILSHMTIANNTNTGWSMQLLVGPTSHAIIENSIIWSESGSAIACLGQTDEHIAILSVEYSTVTNGIDGVHADQFSIVNWYQGNLGGDPIFQSADDGNYLLSGLSPCIDAGNPESPFDPDSTVTDQGARIFNQSLYCLQPGDLTGDGWVNLLDIVLIISCILGDYESCICGDVNSDGLVDATDIVAAVDMILN